MNNAASGVQRAGVDGGGCGVSEKQPQQIAMVFEAADTETRRRILQKRKRELLAELRPINQELQMMDWRELMTSQQVQDDGGAS